MHLHYCYRPACCNPPLMQKNGVFSKAVKRLPNRRKIATTLHKAVLNYLCE